MEKVIKSEDEWREQLTPEQYEITRKKGTERPFTGEYVDTKDDGTYQCVACGNELFSSDTKFDSGTGWPSFFDPATNDAVETRPDNSLFMSGPRSSARAAAPTSATSSTTGPARRASATASILVPSSSTLTTRANQAPETRRGDWASGVGTAHRSSPLRLPEGLGRSAFDEDLRDLHRTVGSLAVLDHRDQVAAGDRGAVERVDELR